VAERGGPALTLPPMLRSYLPAVVFLVLGATVGGVFTVINTYIGARGGPKVKSKADPYECGLPSEVQRGFRFGISFYLIAMLFILFDIEVVFLYPVAVQLRAFGTFALVETIVFIGLLLVAFVYVWRRGALEWR
jgi:NADH-quinone oxidoreductase subunit A